MTSILQSIASPSSMLYWLNLTVVVTLMCAGSLVFVKLFQKRSEVFRHALVVASLIVLPATPIAVWVGSYSQLGLLSIKNTYGVENPSILPLEEPSEVSSQWEGFAPNPIFVDQDATNSEIANDDENEMPEAASISQTRTPTSTTSPVGANVPWGQVVFSALLIVWCCGTLWFVIQTMRGWLLIRRHLGLSSPITEEFILTASKTAARKVGLTNVPPIFKSPLIPVPLSTGLWYSAIILPEDFLRSANREDLEAVLIHELAHIIRRDHWVGLLQRLTVAIYWWNPLVYYVSRRCSSLAEEICDDYVTKSLNSGDDFARLLVSMAERVVNRVEIPLAIGILPARRHDLERRVTRLMQKERKVKTRLSLNHVALAALFGLLMAGATVLSTVWADSRADNPADNSDNESVDANDLVANATGPKEETEKTNSSKDASIKEKASEEESTKQNSITGSQAEGSAAPEKIATLSQTTLRLLKESKDGSQVYTLLSPDGTKMVYWRATPITVSELSTGEKRRYEGAVGVYPVWSPDSKRIAYRDSEKTISILTLESGDVEKTDIRTYPMSWSADGSSLLVADLNKDEHKGLQLVNLETGKTQTVVNPPKNLSVSLSPDGNYILFKSSENEENPDIFVQPIGSEQRIRITSHKGIDRNSLWSADGKHILFMSNRLLGRWDLMARAFQNGKPMGEPRIVVSDIGSDVTLLSYSKTGRLLFITGSLRRAIFSTNIDPVSGSARGEPNQLTDGELIDMKPTWSRNGNYIAYYQQTPETKMRLCVMNSDGSNQRTLLGISFPYIGAMAWLPDNEHILYPGREVNPENPEERLSGIYSGSIRTRQRKLIYQDPEFWGHWSLSPNAKHLAIVSSVKKKYQLYIVDYDGQNRRELVTSDDSLDDAIWFPTFTPDGKEIIYTHEVKREGKTYRNSIMAVPFVGGEPRKIYVNENPQDYVDRFNSSWLRDGRYVFDIRSNPGGRYHYALSLDGKSEPVKLSYKIGNSFRVSPDGSRAVFHQGENIWKLWLMSGYLLNDEVAKK